MSTQRLSARDIFEIYESGKGRRYALLFSVNGAAFAVITYAADHPKGIFDVENQSRIFITIAAFAAAFSAIMYRDIYAFGKYMSKLGKPFSLKIFGHAGKVVLNAIAIILITGWVIFCIFVISVKSKPEKSHKLILEWSMEIKTLPSESDLRSFI